LAQLYERIVVVCLSVYRSTDITYQLATPISP
jgi:hypothetical protein